MATGSYMTPIYSHSQNNLADLKLQYDDIKAKKSSLEASQKTYEERIRKLEVEINQRPEADDVTLLQKELVSVQKMMNELTLQRESEKDNLQKQCNSVQEMCLKLQEEKMELQNTLKTFPSKDEIKSLQEKVSVMSKTVNQLQKELEMKESEKKKLQNDLDKCANYQEIKSMLSEKSNTLEEVQRLSAEKDTLIEKLKSEIETCKVNMEEMKGDREKLFSKIEEGEGASAAMLQLREENARLKDQILLLQQMQGKSENESESKLEDLRSSLKAGCVLSPTLFSLFISGIEKYVNPSQIGLFADDVILWCSDANISKMESQLNKSLERENGSHSDIGRAGSGIFSNPPRNDVKISIRNSDHCSIFRLELIAFSGALNSNKHCMWILTDSRSSIQYLKNGPKIMKSTGLDIISNLARLGQRKQVCLQLILLHVGVPGNEAVDELAGRGCKLPNPSFSQ
ncbi:early endosome antigen 1 [Trichonephila clavipes]|nr:early endosome antigen 1 [Trichonephila clavipes]